MEELARIVGATGGAADLKAQFTNGFLAFFLVMARIMPLMFLTPVLGSRHAPAQLKMGMGILFSALAFFPVYNALERPVPTDLIPFVGLMLKEMAVGMLVGYMTSLIFYGVMMAGRLMDTAATRSMAEVQAPHTKARATPLGDILYMYLLILFFGTGGHLLLINGMLMSFTTFSILDFSIRLSTLGVLAEHLMHIIAELFVIAVLVAAPVMTATFLTDVTFGLLNRVAPQLNAYFMSMPVKALGSVILLWVAWETVSQELTRYITWTIVELQYIYVILAGG